MYELDLPIYYSIFFASFEVANYVFPHLGSADFMIFSTIFSQYSVMEFYYLAHLKCVHLCANVLNVAFVSLILPGRLP